ncbi:MAG: GGDEF domain-containing protein [Myxococcales bacterium]|nr:GGDEF domain-containing protein [Myxococcales bacterium]
MSSPSDPRDALIAQLRAENEALRRQLPRDPETGLYSRAHFDERLSYEWRRAEASWASLSLIVVDTSAFSDEASRTSPAMRRIALMLEDLGRDVDIACRLDDSRIAILLPGTSRTGAEAERARLREELADESLGLGLAVAHSEAHSPLELVLLADEAADRDRRESLHPIAEDPAFDAWTFDSWLSPAVVVPGASIPPPPESGGWLDEDEERIPTIPAPSWSPAA